MIITAFNSLPLEGRMGLPWWLRWKNLPAMQETQSQNWEDPLEKGMATHSSILACRPPWTEELQSSGVTETGHG